MNRKALELHAPEQFQQRALAWYDQYGRKHLPWQQNRTAYRVWVSEIMLQQTQVSTVIPYFERFMQRFPTVAALAEAPIDTVLHLWTGLGYYARARNIHACARAVVEHYNGEFPATVEALTGLPGIGRSTAGAIASMAYHVRAPILDGNVKRVLTRLHAVDGWPGSTQTQNLLWQIAEHYTPNERVQDYTQVMMDLGATLCTRSKPQCAQCPLQDLCAAYSLGTPTAWPHRKPKAEKPVKEAWLLMLQLPDQRCYLTPRPPTGLWGGLWCFPEFSSSAALNEWLVQQGYAPEQREDWNAFRHTFSHFHLDITPVHLRTSNANRVQEQGQWVQPLLDEPLGLAAPTKRLLEKLCL